MHFFIVITCSTVAVNAAYAVAREVDLGASEYEGDAVGLEGGGKCGGGVRQWVRFGENYTYHLWLVHGRDRRWGKGRGERGEGNSILWSISLSIQS